MIRNVIIILRRFPFLVLNYSVGQSYQHWTHRYLLYLSVFIVIGIWTYFALEIYGWLTWRVSSTSFRGNYILDTMMNYAFCLYVTDEWLMRLTGRWGRFDERTFGKLALIWGGSFIVAFVVQRTIVFERIKYFALDQYYFYQQYPELRPRPLDHFLFSLPFLLATVFSLWGLVFLQQRRMSKGQVIIRKEESPLEGHKLPDREQYQELKPLCFRSGGNQIIIEPDTIGHITVEDHYCQVHCSKEAKTKIYYIKSSLAGLKKKLPKDIFIQIHRSHVVNVHAIRQLENQNRVSRVFLKSDAVLPVSRYRVAEVTAQIEEVLGAWVSKG